ncbi:hypothetical protein BC831DRAFT_484405 [Entophlyctis helioformis]|nr:hypothetical protein BC831DRAFT_484405 [Entophlyctis helioformis]
MHFNSLLLLTLAATSGIVSGLPAPKLSNPKTTTANSTPTPTPTPAPAAPLSMGRDWSLAYFCYRNPANSLCARLKK